VVPARAPDTSRDHASGRHGPGHWPVEAATANQVLGRWSRPLPAHIMTRWPNPMHGPWPIIRTAFPPCGPPNRPGDLALGKAIARAILKTAAGAQSDSRRVRGLPQQLFRARAVRSSLGNQYRALDTAGVERLFQWRRTLLQSPRTVRRCVADGRARPERTTPRSSCVSSHPPSIRESLERSCGLWCR